MANQFQLRVEIVTGDSPEDEAYVHLIPHEGSDNNSIMNAIDVLYGHEGVVSIYILLEEMSEENTSEEE